MKIINYQPLHDFAIKHRLSYNELCVVMRAADGSDDEMDALPSELSDVEILSLARLYSLDYANWPQRRFLQFARDLLATPRAATPDEKAKPVAWLFTCKKPDTVTVYASVSKDDGRHWPTEQWESIVCSPLYVAPIQPRQAERPMADTAPPATARERWFYEQGRLAERDPRTLKDEPRQAEPRVTSAMLDQQESATAEAEGTSERLANIRNKLTALPRQAPSDALMPEIPTPAMLYALWKHRDMMHGQSENTIARAHYAELRAAIRASEPRQAPSDALDAARYRWLRGAWLADPDAGEDVAWSCIMHSCDEDGMDADIDRAIFSTQGDQSQMT